jgi:hypothetical protein
MNKRSPTVVTRKHCLYRTAMVDLQFEGETLCNVSTREPGQSRWTEIRIYKTVTNRWVSEILGRSNIALEALEAAAKVDPTIETVESV